MNMTNLEPRYCNNIYYNSFYKYKDLLESVCLTLKCDIRYYTTDSERIYKTNLSDELWEAITWIQKKFWKLNRKAETGEHRQDGSNTVVSNFHYGAHPYEHNTSIPKPPKEAFDLVEGFIFISKNHEIPETIKRMMDEEEAEKMLEG